MIVGSPTNAIAVGLLDQTIGVQISFAQWMLYGIPLVLLGVPLAALIVAKVNRIGAQPFDVAAARHAITTQHTWTEPERRLVPLVALAMLLWVTQPLTEPLLPDGALTDGTIAVFVGLLLFVIPDGTGRPMLTWPEANRAPWDVIMMFGGGLALAALITTTGLAQWIGDQLTPFTSMPVWIVATIVVAVIILVTEFASNVATASGFIPVIAGMVVVSEIHPALLAVPTAMAASWGFMLPSGTGPNAFAFATGELRVADMVRAGFLLDLIGLPIIVGCVFAVATLMS